MSGTRPLPPRPNLEFEKKQAKALARRLGVRLSAAQFQIAREYGFASWPKLVRYFVDVARQEPMAMIPESPEACDSEVRGVLGSHRARRGFAGHVLAAYVPRFYGKPVEEIYAAEVTEEEARLATARMHGCPNWEELLALVTQRTESFGLRDRREAREMVRSALLSRNLEWLDHILTEHDDRELLNHALCGQMCMPTEIVQLLLDRGADPNWAAPNGIPVLEHALIRYWNGEAVDLIAARATPRKALWIAAGLGDMDGVRRSLDANGKPTAAARRLRPEFDMVGQRGLPMHPDPDDEEVLLQAFFVAMLNSRTSIIEYMASRGFNVNTLIWDSPVLNIAVGNAWVPVVESLVRCGADPDLKGWHPDMSAREIARDLLEQAPEDATRRQVAELVSG
jgi:hypothetical protein